MPDISITAVRHVAALARLGLTDQRAEDLTRDLNGILEHMSVLAKLDTQGVAEAAGVGAAAMRLREDEGPQIPLDQLPEKFAPATRAGFLLVPRLATHEDSETSA